MRHYYDHYYMHRMSETQNFPLPSLSQETQTPQGGERVREILDVVHQDVIEAPRDIVGRLAAAAACSRPMIQHVK